MEFNLKRDELLPVLRTARAVADKKITIPILGYAKLKATEGNLQITATDMDVAIQANIAAEVIRDGSLCVILDRLIPVIEKGGDAYDFSLDGTDLVIKSGSFKTKLRYMDANDFPAFPTVAAATGHIVSGDILGAALGSVAYAITTEQSRWALNCIQLKTNSHGFQAVAIDGHVLSIFNTKPGMTEPVDTVLIPKKTVAILRNWLTDTDITVSSDKHHALFESAHATIATRLNSGQFPNYELVIPKGHKQSTMPLPRLIEAIERALVLSNDELHTPIKLTAKDGMVQVLSKGQNGEMEDHFTIDDVAMDLRTKCNGTLLLNLLKSLGGENASIFYKDADSQLEFRSETDTRLLQGIIMPMTEK